MIAGPGLVGTAVAQAGLFGIGPDMDFLDPCGHGNNNKSDSHHPRPGADVNTQSSRTTAAIDTAEAPKAKVGSAPENAVAPQALSAGENVGVANNAAVRSLASVPQNIVVAQGGGGGIPRSTAGRAGNLTPVSTAPSTRSVVIRGTPLGAGGAPATAVAPSTLGEGRSAALAAPPPVAPEPEGQPAPAAPPAPSPATPTTNEPLAPGISGIAKIPDSYRAGYAQYLRAASTSDLIVEALPGVAGIAGFTLIGAFAGYRQARAVQKALLAPVPTRILL